MRFPGVERSDHAERALDPLAREPHAVRALGTGEQVILVLERGMQVIDVDLLIVLVHHPVAEFGVGGGYAYKLYGCGNITETIWARGWYASESRTTRSPARAIDELIAGPNAEIIDTY